MTVLLLVPEVVPRIQVTAATPCAVVTAVVPTVRPPPAVTVKVTVTPPISAPFWSRTVTPMLAGSDVLTVPLWPSPVVVTVVGTSVAGG